MSHKFANMETEKVHVNEVFLLLTAIQFTSLPSMLTEEEGR